MVLAVAASGIAATLLKGGRTAHSTLKIPIKIFDTSICSIKKHTPYAEPIKQASLIIWDEVPMQHRHCIEAFNRTLQDLHDSQDVDFANTTFLFSGDYRQTLPVIHQGSREDVVAACFNKSQLWNHLQILHLTRNFRLHNVDGAADWAKYLLQVGSGETTSAEGQLNLDADMSCGSTLVRKVQRLLDSAKIVITEHLELFYSPLERRLLLVFC